jgi:hypothetical protein
MQHGFPIRLEKNIEMNFYILTLFRFLILVAMITVGVYRVVWVKKFKIYKSDSIINIKNVYQTKYLVPIKQKAFFFFLRSFFKQLFNI